MACETYKLLKLPLTPIRTTHTQKKKGRKKATDYCLHFLYLVSSANYYMHINCILLTLTIKKSNLTFMKMSLLIKLIKIQIMKSVGTQAQVLGSVVWWGEMA